ncbi:MAG: bifunctional DNA-formamidopyrimidine glycosylase/DNA-(apurinic or apyrimidinic site) lyase [Candidatus Moraniibacteriota bacterium]
MPELPEVQTIVSDLESLVGQQFVGFFSLVPKAIKNSSLANFTKEITGQKIKAVSRLGKIILIKLNSGKTIAIHLKMTGKLLLNFQFPISNFQSNHNSKIFKQAVEKLQKDSPYVHHMFFLKNNSTLGFSDVRKFATISLLDDSEINNIKNKYGVDPIADNFTLKNLTDLLAKGKSRQIKESLMNNALILGIGNIYASEILFDAKILPARKTNSLNENEIKVLHKSIKKILLKAIKLRGTSISDYRDANDKSGSFQTKLFVYKRQGQKCKKCATIISRSVIGQRSTFFCASCQK